MHKIQQMKQMQCCKIGPKACGQCRWQQLGSEWAARFTFFDHVKGPATWLRDFTRKDGSWGVGCLPCALNNQRGHFKVSRLHSCWIAK